MTYWMRALMALTLMIGLSSPAMAVEEFQESLVQDAAGATGNGLSIAVTRYAAISVDVTISATATVSFETSGAGGTWTALACLPVSSTTGIPSITATASGLYQCNVAALMTFRARISSFGSGTVSVFARASTAVFGRKGGGLPAVTSEGDCLLVSGGVPAFGPCPGAGTGAPTNASYLTKVAEATLSNEFALGSLATALLVNTTTTGVPTAYAGTTCTNQVLRVLSSIGGGTCITITSAYVDTSIWTGTVSSGILKASSQGIAAQATAGTDYTSPSSTESPTNKTLDCNATGNSCSNVDLTADVIGILPGANGGTANGFMAFSGPASTLKTFSLPNASASILTTNAKVTLAQGGTNQDTWTPSDCVRVNAGGTALESAGAACGSGSGGAPADATYWVGAANGTLSNEINLGALGTGVVINTGGTPSIYAGVTCTNQFVRILGASANGTCASVSLTADITGTLGIANGGSALTTVAVNQIFVATNTDVFAAKTLPSCSNATTSKLLYNNSTQAFSCGTDQAGGGGGAATAVTPAYVLVNGANTPYTALSTDRKIHCDASGGARVIQLPAATVAIEYTISHVGPNTCTVTAAGADTILGAATAVMKNPVYSALITSSDGTSAWQIY